MPRFLRTMTEEEIVINVWRYAAGKCGCGRGDEAVNGDAQLKMRSLVNEGGHGSDLQPADSLKDVDGRWRLTVDEVNLQCFCDDVLFVCKRSTAYAGASAGYVVDGGSGQ